MKQERPFDALIPFLPPNTYEQVLPYFRQHPVHLTLTPDRKSVLGDYRHPTKDAPYHRISINGSLNPYSFLITLLHELAHMLVYLQYQGKVAPHGAEWKNQFQQMLLPYVGQQFFPPDIEQALIRYLNNPKASTCTDSNLFKALHRYSHKSQAGWVMLDSLPIGVQFRIEKGGVYQLLERRRTRYKCLEIASGKLYLFPGIYEVKPIDL